VHKGAGDVFVARLDPHGMLLYSTFLGGAGEDNGFSVAAEVYRRA
jgi:hypothetical protein